MECTRCPARHCAARTRARRANAVARLNPRHSTGDRLAHRRLLEEVELIEPLAEHLRVVGAEPLAEHRRVEVAEIELERDVAATELRRAQVGGGAVEAGLDDGRAAADEEGGGLA